MEFSAEDALIIEIAGVQQEISDVAQDLAGVQDQMTAQELKNEISKLTDLANELEKLEQKQ